MKNIIIGSFLKVDGEHIAAWRHPSTTSNGGGDIESFLKAAVIAERGLLDFIFMGDIGADLSLPASVLRHCSWLDKMEPFSVLTALASVTKSIGLAGTASTTFNEPYPLARRLLSIDHISSGRLGWNVVTSINEADAKNHGGGAFAEVEKRYERAEEFVDVVFKLWSCWRKEDLLRNRDSGIYFKNETLPYINHKGPHFSVQGPLDLSPSPQERPVIIQAGSSESGRNLAARTADIVFTVQGNIDAARSFYADLNSRAEKFDRPNKVSILSGLQVWVGNTEAEAIEKHNELQALLDPKVALVMLRTLLGGVDLGNVDLEAPVDQALIDHLSPAKGLTSRREGLLKRAIKLNMSLTELAIDVAGSRGHATLIGTPEQIADHMELWTSTGACDGFLLLPPLSPLSLNDFVEMVIPVLQSRGLFRKRYEETKFRERISRNS